MPTKSTESALILGSFLLFVACGDHGSALTSDGSGSGASSMPGHPPPEGESGQNGGSNGTAMAVKCPTMPPSPESPCTGEGGCSYGTSPRIDCRMFFVCTFEGAANGRSRWFQSRAGDCKQPPDGFCPVAPQPGQGCVVIANPGDRVPCTYPDNTMCQCICGRPCQQTGSWSCFAPPSGRGCPATPPNYGTQCPAQGIECRYANPCEPGGAVMFCRGGIWEQGDGMCI